MGSGHNRVLIAFISFFLAASEGAALALGDANEVWVSARTNALGTGLIWGTGAITNPYYGDFNAIMGSLPTNTTIHLLPGVHWTTGYEYAPGDFSLKANQKIIGAGIDVTIVKRDRTKHPDTAQNEGELAAIGVSGVEISDLTVDASGSNSDYYINGGVYLRGNYYGVRRVKVINCSGNKSNGQESHGIMLGDIGAKGNIVSQCEVSSVQGDYVDGVWILGQGIAEDNRVYFPPVTPAYEGSLFAYAAAYTEDARFSGNICEGGSVGFYTDTGFETNLTIIGNTFKGVINGIIIGKSPGFGWAVDGVSISDNIIEISTNVPVYSGNWSYAIAIGNAETTWPPTQRIKITGNTLHYLNDNLKGNQAETAGIWLTTLMPTNFFNVRVVGNTIDRSFVNSVNLHPNHPQKMGKWWADNVDLNGIPIQVTIIGTGSGGSIGLT